MSGDILDDDNIESLLSLIEHNKKWEGLQNIDVEAYEQAADTIKTLLEYKKALESTLKVAVDKERNECVRICMDYANSYKESKQPEMELASLRIASKIRRWS